MEKVGACVSTLPRAVWGAFTLKQSKLKSQGDPSERTLVRSPLVHCRRNDFVGTRDKHTRLVCNNL